MFVEQPADWTLPYTTEKIYASDGASGDDFGRVISVSKDLSTVVVSATGVDPGTTGAAYVFTWDGSEYVQRQKLSAASISSSGNYGRALAVNEDGTLIFVGSSIFPEVAEVWTTSGTNTWSRTFSFPEGDDGGTGASIACNAAGDVVAVGNSQNSLDVWEKTGPGDSDWTNTFTAEPFGAFTYSNVFGHDHGETVLSEDGDVLAISSWPITVSGVDDAGVTFTYKRVTGVWSNDSAITATAPAYQENLGKYLAIDEAGTTLAMSASNYNSGDGRMHYTTGGLGAWSSSPAAFTRAVTADGFGLSCDLNGDAEFMCVSYIQNNGYLSVYKKSVGVYTAVKTISYSHVGVSGSGFAHTVVMSDDAKTIFAGAENDTTPIGTSRGAVYILRV